MKPAEGLRSLRAIARELGVPERILAADTARFAAAIPYRMIEGKRRYGPGAAAALRLIVRLRAAGREDGAIDAELARGPVAIVPPTPPLAIDLPDLATALNRRRERRLRALAAMREALHGLGASADRHAQRVAALRAAVEVHGADLNKLRYYDNVMARFRAELRMAERSMADVYRTATDNPGAGPTAR